MDNANTYKPENALKRSNELIAQNQQLRALTTLHDVLIHKRGRAWFAVLEEVMLRHLKLCIELRKEKFAREGLMQYRLLCQHVNVASLDKVINTFLDQAEQKVKAAQASSEDAVKALEGRDLDEESEASSEGLLMLAFSGGSVKDRTERELLTPWIRFLWQCYRLSLDVARQNPKFEAIFHETAKKAFGFCLRYRRRQEFRRLADTVRQYFNFQTRFKPETLSELLGNQEAFIRMVEMRFKQLSVATQLDLWNEAYKSIEDIHAVIVFFKRTPPPRLMSEYFERLSQVFWVSTHRLFHAYAVQKQYTTILNNKQSRKSATDEALQLLASKVLLATICVPFWDKTNMHRSKEEMFQFSQDRQKHEKIIQLLGASVVPNRKSLLTTMLSSGILDKVYPELAKLYTIVEGDVSPLNICKQVAPMADFVEKNKELERYADALRRNAAVRMLEHIAQTYERISFDAVTSLCPFYNFPQLELLILQVAKSEVVGGSVSIDHSNKYLSFKGREVTSDTLAGQLSVVTHRLAPLLYTCRASATRGPLHRTTARPPSDFLQKLNDQLKQEREENLRRQQVIDKRQEEREQREKEQDALERGKREEEQRKLKENEIQRMKQEQMARQQQKEEEAQRAADMEQARQIYDAVASQVGGKATIKKGSNADDRMKILDDAKKLLLHQKEEKEKRLEKEAKRTEYFERACREEERPLLQKQWEELQAAELASKETNKQAVLEEAKLKWEQALEEKRRLARMERDWDKFRSKIIQKRKEQMEEEGEDEGEWEES